jgi:hypothetical protein
VLSTLRDSDTPGVSREVVLVDNDDGDDEMKERCQVGDSYIQ